MILKGEDNRNIIKIYPIIKEYKYLIIIDDKIQINHYIYSSFSFPLITIISLFYFINFNSIILRQFIQYIEYII